MIIQAKDIYTGWVALLQTLLDAPEAGPRGKLTRERLGLKLRIDDGLANIIADEQRKLNYRFMVAEWLWMLCGREDVASLLKFNSKIAEFSDNGTTFHGAYGKRTFDQWAQLARRFARDARTRHGVLLIWRPDELAASWSSKDVPCTIALQFILRADDTARERLHTVATMRSSDAWLGIPYDFFNFSMIGNMFAAHLTEVLRTPVTPGFVEINAGSSHLYQATWETARSIVNAPTGRAIGSPRLVMPFDYLGFDRLLSTGRFDATFSERELTVPWAHYRDVLLSASSSSALISLMNAERGAEAQLHA